MQHSNRELWAAFIAVVLITLFYLLTTILLGNLPASSGLIGHGIGILGFILMIMTEFLYTWRKRSRRASWGRMSQWLDFHIFTGIVGPYMVLLHSAWNFQGLAGVTMLFTVIIVISGFIGRYIYTAVPRTVDGVELEAGQLQSEIVSIQVELNRWMGENPEAAQSLANLLPAASIDTGGSNMSVTRSWSDWRERARWGRMRRKVAPALRPQADRLDALVRRQAILRRQVSSLAAARRTLSLWHAVHIPIGMVLFAAAIIHIVAAFYYATLLR